MATVDLGKQQVSIYPYQDLTSLNGNQILYELYHQGAHNVRCEVRPWSTSQFDIYIKAGTVIFFEKMISDYMDPELPLRPAIIKVVISEDTPISEPGTHLEKLDLYNNAEFLYVYAVWTFSIETDAEKYAQFFINKDPAQYELDKADPDKVILAKFLNIPATFTPPGTMTDIQQIAISYEPKEYREPWLRAEKVLDNFLVEFEGDGSGVVVTPGDMIVGGSYVYSTKTPSPIAPPVLSTNVALGDLYQIDVLGYHGYTYSDPVIQAPRFSWQSFTFSEDSGWAWSDTIHSTGDEYGTDPLISQDQLKAYLHGKKLAITDDQYVILFLIRKISGTYPSQTISNKMWPDWCIIPDALTPRVGTVNRYSVVNIPVID